MKGDDTEEDSSSQQLSGALDEVERLRVENERLRGLLGMTWPSHVGEAVPSYTLFPLAEPLPRVDEFSPIREKARLMRAIFRGRDDVYAVRWTSARTGKVGYSPATVGGWSDANKASKNYLPLTDDVIEEHLSGRQTTP